MTSTENPTTTVAYNGQAQVTGITDPRNETTVMAYDANGDLTSVTDPLSHATTFTYDALREGTPRGERPGSGLLFAVERRRPHAAERGHPACCWRSAAIGGRRLCGQARRRADVVAVFI